MLLQLCSGHHDYIHLWNGRVPVDEKNREEKLKSGTGRNIDVPAQDIGFVIETFQILRHKSLIFSEAPCLLKKEIFSFFKFRNIITPTWTSGLGNYQMAKAQSWRPVPERYRNIVSILTNKIFKLSISRLLLDKQL